MTNQIEAVNKLHRRHTAKLLTKLTEINSPSIVIDAVKQHFSYYTNDIKNQVLLLQREQHDRK